MAAAPPAPAASAEDNSQEGYQTGGRLGEGPGEVYEASHARLPGRFAIKFLTRARGAAPAVIEVFQREAEQVSVLRHPNIVEFLELGLMPDGTPIIVMEQLDGRSLEDMIAKRLPIPLAEVLPIIRGIATGLEAAHGVGVVHREIRPDNIFLARPVGYEQGFPKILDFGVSCLAPAGPSSGSGVTAANARYLAPEQAAAQLGEVDAGTDQYSLAAIAYRMLSGTPLFSGDDVISVLYHVLHDTLPPLTSLARVPSSVDAVIRKAMSKDKRRRFDSVFMFAKSLEDAATGSGRGVNLSAVPTPPPEPAPAREPTPPPMRSEPAYSQPSYSESAYREPPRSESARPLTLQSDPVRSPTTSESEPVRSARTMQGEPSRALSLRDTLSRQFFEDGERKAEEGTWTAQDLDDERPDGADDYDSFDDVPRRRWPLVVAVGAAIALVPILATVFPDWRLLLSARPSDFWSTPHRNDVVLPTSVPGQPSTPAAAGAPTEAEVPTAVPSGTVLGGPAPIGQAAAPAATPTALAPAPAAAPTRAVIPAHQVAAPAAPIAAPTPAPAPRRTPPPRAAAPAAPPPAAPPAPAVAAWPPPSTPPAPAAAPTGARPAPGQYARVGDNPTAPNPSPPPPRQTQGWYPAPPTGAAPAQPVAPAAAPGGGAAYPPAAPPPPAAAPESRPPPSQNALRGYVWSPKEGRLVPAQ